MAPPPDSCTDQVTAVDCPAAAPLTVAVKVAAPWGWTAVTWGETETVRPPPPPPPPPPSGVTAPVTMPLHPRASAPRTSVKTRADLFCIQQPPKLRSGDRPGGDGATALTHPVPGWVFAYPFPGVTRTLYIAGSCPSTLDPPSSMQASFSVRRAQRYFHCRGERRGWGGTRPPPWRPRRGEESARDPRDPRRARTVRGASVHAGDGGVLRAAASGPAAGGQDLRHRRLQREPAAARRGHPRGAAL